jgi:hypothetical protein
MCPVVRRALNQVMKLANFWKFLGVLIGWQLSLHVPANGAAECDVVVYGGTSGGVVAAVQAARDGRSVVLISQGKHLGGLTTSGLGWTDLGSTKILGGLSRDFYQEIYRYYQAEDAWTWEKRAAFGNRGQGAPAFDPASELGSVFEPKVAEGVLNRWIEENKVRVIIAGLAASNGVRMEGKRIAGLRLDTGEEVAGKMFIDASYEGDLLAAAGVSFTVGREANTTYGETVSGIQAERAKKNQLPGNIDPYVVKGDAQSGLLPGVNPDPGGADGSADKRLQAYCYRMVLTDVAANRVMIEKPGDYDEKEYELLFRAIEAGQNKEFFKFSMVPNRKTDSNNSGGISTDYIGMNYGNDWDWTTLSAGERQALAKRHERWQRGLVWTLQNHPRVPESIRKEHAKWGLPKDEFADNGNWPYDLYVREARRMVSDYVMTQQHCLGKVVAPDPVGMAAYAMDSHNTQRHAGGGTVRNEGDVQLSTAGPYPVSYRSIIPKRGECENLLVPWSLSASHMAFGSIRMEPVFMGLAQSAAIAADLALDENLSVQQVDYAQLRPRLVAAGQELGGEPPAPAK